MKKSIAGLLLLIAMLMLTVAASLEAPAAPATELGSEPCPPPCVREFDACALACGDPAEGQCRREGDVLACMAP